VAVVTIGGALEKEASALTSGSDPLCGYLLDRIGSLAVESLADRLEKSLRYDYGARRKSVSSRFSPGYCYWPIEEQLKLDRLLAFAEAGVTLNEACMMVPKKSISCIMAVADEGVFREFVSSCDICEKQECDFRR
jgi:cobalamin-dependent methionine synthase I